MFAGMRCRGFEKDNNLYLKTLSDGLLILFRARDTHSLVLKEFKVLARVKKGEFSKFLISGRLDKVFQELSFKRKSTKKYYFSAKLLDVEVYCTLIVLSTR